jgi:hypothetical protein
MSRRSRRKAPRAFATGWSRWRPSWKAIRMLATNDPSAHSSSCRDALSLPHRRPRRGRRDRYFALSPRRAAIRVQTVASSPGKAAAIALLLSRSRMAAVAVTARAASQKTCRGSRHSDGKTAKRSNGQDRNRQACNPAFRSDRSPQTASEVLLPNHLHLSTINPVQTVRHLPGSYPAVPSPPAPLPSGEGSAR